MTLFVAYLIVTAIDAWLLVAGILLFMVVWPIHKEICKQSNELGLIGTDEAAFESVESCEKGWAWLIALSITVFSLIYFPLKIHFNYVLHAFIKEYEENETKSVVSPAPVRMNTFDEEILRNNTKTSFGRTGSMKSGLSATDRAPETNASAAERDMNTSNMPLATGVDQSRNYPAEPPSAGSVEVERNGSKLID